MSIISDSLKKIKPSPTIAVTQKARELKAAGKDVIGLGAGEPDFDTPDNIKEAAIKAINDGDTKYSAVDGTSALKKAIVEKFKKENNLDYTTDQITVGAGGKPIVMKCDEKQGFKINPSDLEKFITPKTKWIILNSPSNPTGACYSENDIKAIAAVLEKHKHIYILSDDIYEHVTYEGFKFFTIAQIESLKDRVLTMNGVSKAYSMTGWRIGYAAGPKDIVKAIAKIQSQSTTNPSSISQAASVEALSGTQDFIKKRADSFQERRDFVVKALNDIDGINCLNPDGAFYVFPSCKELMGKKDPSGKEIKSDTDFVQSLLENSGIAVVQGSAFGLEGFFRISYATSMENLKKALEKISSFCKSLS